MRSRTIAPNRVPFSSFVPIPHNYGGQAGRAFLELEPRVKSWAQSFGPFGAHKAGRYSVALPGVSCDDHALFTTASQARQRSTVSRIMKTQGIGPVFQVSNLDDALKYYKGVLGFKEDFQFGAYAGVSHGDACLHLTANRFHERLVGRGSAFIFCDEVEDYCQEIKKNGAVIKVERPTSHTGCGILSCWTRTETT